MTRLRNVIGYLITAGLFAWAGIWVTRNWDSVSRAFSLRPGYLLALIPMVVVGVILSGLMNQLMASHLGAPLRFVQWASLAFASTMANYGLPLAGVTLRAGYYKRQSGFPIASFASGMAVAYVVTVLVNSLTVIAAVAWIGPASGRALPPLMWAAAAVAAVCGLVLAFSPKAAKGEPTHRIWNALARVHAGWDMLRHSPALLAKAFALSLAATLLYALRLWIAFAATGHPTSIPACLLVGGLAALSMFISLTPASLGIREGVIIFSSYAVGVPPEVSLIASTLDRTVAMVIVLPIGSLAAFRLSRETAGA